MNSLDQILDQRRGRVSSKQRTAYAAFSAFVHVGLAAALWFAPDLFAGPPRTFDSVTVSVVAPAALGIEDPEPLPPPPPPPSAEPEPEPEPLPPPPSPAPDPDVPVMPQENPDPPPPQPKATPPPPKPAPPPPPRQPTQRRGSPFGNPLGSTSENAVVGVDDPNFTYGYYIDRVAVLIKKNWVRPEVGGDIREARFRFRIQRDGTITELELEETSGSEVFDRAAQRAVLAASPLPPLPKGYKERSLGITLIVD